MAQIWWFIFLGLELAKCWYSIRGPRVAMKYPSSVTFLGWWWVYRDPVFLKCCLEKETSKGSGNGHELNHLDFDTFKTWFKEWDSLQIAWGGVVFFFQTDGSARHQKSPDGYFYICSTDKVSAQNTCPTKLKPTRVDTRTAWHKNCYKGGIFDTSFHRIPLQQALDPWNTKLMKEFLSFCQRIFQVLVKGGR